MPTTVRNMTTTSRAGHPVNVYYITEFLKRAMPEMVYAQWGLEASLPMNEGDTVLWERMANPTAQTTPLSEGEDPTPVLASITDIRATVSPYGAYMSVSSWADLTAPNSYGRQRTRFLADMHSLTIDTLARNTLAGCLSQTTATKGSPTGSMINTDDIDTIAETLLMANASRITKQVEAGVEQGTSPVLAGFIGIAHTAIRNDLRGLSNYLDTIRYGQRIKPYPAEVGATGDVRWLLTTNGYTSGSNYYCVILGEEAYGTVKIKGADKLLIHLTPEQVGSPLLQYGTYGWKCTYATRILRDDWMHILIVTRGARP